MDASSPKSDLDLQKPLERFRANSKRLAVHPVEQVVLWAVSAHLVFLPWALGAMRPWGQITSLVLALLGFVLALIPRQYTEEHTGSNSFRLVMWPRLIRFPLFWLGLAMLGLVTTQGLNPAWNYVTNGKAWWMQATPHINWLPSGVNVPFERWGPWRMMLIYASVWLTACTVWVGFTRRRSLQSLFIVIATNGLLLAGFGIAQRMLGNGKMFWFFESPNEAFFSSFIYKNHGAAYLLLTLAVTCGLASWYYLRGLRRLEKSNPSGLFTFFATCIAVAILTSYARGATLTMLAFLGISVAVFIGHQLLMKDTTRKPIVAVVLLLVFGFFLKTGLEALNTGEAWSRIKSGLTRLDTSLQAREWATAASQDMLKDYWKSGAGVGSFRFLFPTYQHRNPKLIDPPQYWEHAHNDILEIPIELGLVGLLVVGLCTGYLLISLTRVFFWENPLSGCTVLGTSLLVVYSWWDFPLQCPAILITCCTLGVAITSWTKLEEMNVRG